MVCSCASCLATRINGSCLCLDAPEQAKACGVELEGCPAGPLAQGCCCRVCLQPPLRRTAQRRRLAASTAMQAAPATAAHSAGCCLTNWPAAKRQRLSPPKPHLQAEVQPCQPKALLQHMHSEPIS